MDSVLRSKAAWFSWPAFSLFLGGLLWVMALAQPVFYTNENTIMGFWVLAMGWAGFIVLQFAWYANLLALLAVLLMYRYPNRAMWIAVAAVLLAGQAFWFEYIPNEQLNLRVMGLGLGFWLWYASMVFVTLGVIFGAGEAMPLVVDAADNDEESTDTLSDEPVLSESSATGRIEPVINDFANSDTGQSLLDPLQNAAVTTQTNNAASIEFKAASTATHTTPVIVTPAADPLPSTQSSKTADQTGAEPVHKPQATTVGKVVPIAASTAGLLLFEDALNEPAANDLPTTTQHVGFAKSDITAKLEPQTGATSEDKAIANATENPSAIQEAVDNSLSAVVDPQMVLTQNESEGVQEVVEECIEAKAGQVSEEVTQLTAQAEDAGSPASQGDAGDTETPQSS